MSVRDTTLYRCVCGSDWWVAERQIQVEAAEVISSANAPGMEPPCQQYRTVLRCAECGQVRT